MLGRVPRYPPMMLGPDRPHDIVPDVERALRAGWAPPVEDAARRGEDAYCQMVHLLPRRLGLSAGAVLQALEPVLEQEARESGTLWKAGASGWRLDKSGRPVTEGWPFLPPASLPEGTGAVYIQHGSTKQRALAQISERCGLGTDGRGWLAFGDTTNDLEMLEWAEWSVCPANAKAARAKEIANEVSELTNDEAFVADAIERALAWGPGGGSRRATL